jgi:hypothetical protein
LARTVPDRVGELSLVRLSPSAPESLAAASRGAAGAAPVPVSIVSARAAEAGLALPARSTCLTVMLCAPLASAVTVPMVVFHAPEAFAEVVPTRIAPS